LFETEQRIALNQKLPGCGVHANHCIWNTSK